MHEFWVKKNRIGRFQRILKKKIKFKSRKKFKARLFVIHEFYKQKYNKNMN